MEDVGVAVYCSKCDRRKAPRGRSVPMVMADALCQSDCLGYYETPEPGQLWPGETREEFGF